MKNILSKLSSRSFKNNKSRNLIATIAIMMTSIMFTTLFTVGFSMIQSMSRLGISTGNGAQSMLIVISAIVMILVSGYLIIFNIFQISVSQDIQFYGVLKTLGATKSHIRRIIVSQAVKLWGIGTPIGLLIGFGIGTIIMPRVLVSLGAEAELSISPFIFVFAAVFTLITILLSSLKPANVAGKVSPIVAMKYVDSDINYKCKTKRINVHFSIHGMAFANLKRNKKRTVTVIISIALGFMLMNSLYVYQNSFDEETYVKSYLGSDIALTNGALDRASYQRSSLVGTR